LSRPHLQEARAIANYEIKFISWHWSSLPIAIAAQLQRDGWSLDRKWVLRLMREDNLLCLRKRRFVVTTDSAHGLLIYPNLVTTLTATGINQLWLSDIIYVRLLNEFVYLAMILDGCSRRCIGWSLSRQLDTYLNLEALDHALEQRTIEPDLVHHSNRGVQYTSQRYTELLKAHDIQISMSRHGNPYNI